ncbi:hypothetical protein ACWGK1_29840 [Streptomyces wedmorensis]
MTLQRLYLVLLVGSVVLMADSAAYRPHTGSGCRARCSSWPSA